MKTALRLALVPLAAGLVLLAVLPQVEASSTPAPTPASTPGTGIVSAGPPCYKASCFAVWCVLNLGACITPGSGPTYVCGQHGCIGCAATVTQDVCTWLAVCLESPSVLTCVG